MSDVRDFFKNFLMHQPTEAWIKNQFAVPSLSDQLDASTGGTNFDRADIRQSGVGVRLDQTFQGGSSQSGVGEGFDQTSQTDNSQSQVGIGSNPASQAHIYHSGVPVGFDRTIGDKTGGAVDVLNLDDFGEKLSKGAHHLVQTLKNGAIDVGEALKNGVSDFGGTLKKEAGDLLGGDPSDPPAADQSS